MAQKRNDVTSEERNEQIQLSSTCYLCGPLLSGILRVLTNNKINEITKRTLAIASRNVLNYLYFLSALEIFLHKLYSLTL